MASHTRPKMKPAQRRVAANGSPSPSLEELRAQARDALREEEGRDFGPLTHAERNKILFGL